MHNSINVSVMCYIDSDDRYSVWMQTGQSDETWFASNRQKADATIVAQEDGHFLIQQEDTIRDLAAAMHFQHQQPMTDVQETSSGYGCVATQLLHLFVVIHAYSCRCRQHTHAVVLTHLLVLDLTLHITRTYS